MRHSNTKTFLFVTALILSIIQTVFAQQIEAVYTLSDTGDFRTGKNSFALGGNGDAFRPEFASDPAGNINIRLVGINDTVEAPFLDATTNWRIDALRDWITPDVLEDLDELLLSNSPLLNLWNISGDSQSRFLVEVAGLNTDSHTVLIKGNGEATSWSHNDAIQWNRFTSEYGAVGGGAREGGKALHLDVDNGLITELHSVASEANDIAGDVVVGEIGVWPATNAVKWERNGDGWNSTELPGVESCAWSYAVDVNEAGEIIGICGQNESFNSPIAPLFWDTQGNLDTDLQSSVQLTDPEIFLTEDGSVVGVGENGAFEWHQSTGMTPLHFDHTGIGFDTTNIADANDRGEMILVDFSGLLPRYVVATKTSVSEIAGDFNHDGLRDLADLNQLVDAKNLNAETFALFDLDANGSINDADVDAWRAIESRFALADLDENGVIDSEDLGRLLNNFGSPSSQLTDGDINNDQIVDSSDLGLMLNNFGLQSLVASDPMLVPEPSFAKLLAAWLALLMSTRIRRRQL